VFKYVTGKVFSHEVNFIKGFFVKILLVSLLSFVMLMFCSCESVTPKIESEPVSVFIQRDRDHVQIKLSAPDANTPTEPLTTSVPSDSVIISKMDPYSYVAKAYYMLEQNPEYFKEVVYHTVFGDSVAQNERRLKKEFSQGFEMRNENPFYLLWHCVLFEERSDFFYVLYDLDGNGLNELLLSADGYLFDIYAAENGIARQQNSLGIDENPPSLLKNNIICVDGSSELDNWIRYFRFADGALNFQLGLFVDDDGFYRTSINDEKILITEDEYESLRSEFENDGQKVSIDWQPLAKYER
jgi:hypothetical protein